MVFENRRAGQNVARALGLAVLSLAVLWVLVISQALAQGSITLDGVGDEWSPGWQVSTDPLDVTVTGLGTHPHEAPAFARSGYDAVGLWAHYDVAGEIWYFRLDVDGRVGDSDSTVGTAGNLGVGTHGPDGGPLGTDGDGIGTAEAYRLRLQYQSGGSFVRAELGNDAAILPGVVSTTTAELAGLGIYSTTVPGVIEWAFDRQTVFPTATAHGELWLSAQMGDNSDSVSDDEVSSVLLIALDQMAQCPASPIVVGDEATFPLNYAIPASTTLEVSDVVLSADVPTGTTFLSASAGGIESGGIITWPLGALLPGDAGQVTFTLRVDDPEGTSLVIDSEMTCAEGLRYPASVVCPVLQATPTPPPPPTRTPPPATPQGPPGEIPEPATVILVLGGLGGLLGYGALRQRKRGRT